MTAIELRAALRELGLSQAEFSRRSGCAASTVGNWTSGRWPVPVWVEWLIVEMRKVKTLRDLLV